MHVLLSTDAAAGSSLTASQRRCTELDHNRGMSNNDDTVSTMFMPGGKVECAFADIDVVPAKILAAL